MEPTLDGNDVAVEWTKLCATSKSETTADLLTEFAAHYRAEGMREAATICGGLARKHQIQKSDRRARMADLCAAAILESIRED